ncbi:MAG TPA: hypothetical protein EYH01_00410 [Campylobacterales bacterium]|nr:hypothetical protein [Campylobacterales bacterium]
MRKLSYLDLIELTIPKAPFRDRMAYEPDSWLLFNKFNETATKNSFNINITAASGGEEKGKKGLTTKGSASRKSYQKMDW